MPVDVTKLRFHPWSFFYFWLKLKVTLVRASPKGVSRKAIRVPSRDNGRTILVYRFDSTSSSHKGPRPVHINMHGSGFVIPFLGTDSEFCGRVAQGTGAIVLDSDYRKSPEYPFPAAYHDIIDVVNYVLKNADNEFDLNNITISGFSAGGALALTVGTTFGPEKIKGIVGIYASPDLANRYTAPKTEFDSGSIITKPIRDMFYDSLILQDIPRDIPEISARFRPTSSFPKHILLTCGDADGLYEPAKALIDRLHSEGITDAQFIPIEREAHAFDKNPKTPASEKRTEELIVNAVDFIKNCHSV